MKKVKDHYNGLNKPRSERQRRQTEEKIIK